MTHEAHEVRDTHAPHETRATHDTHVARDHPLVRALTAARGGRRFALALARGDVAPRDVVARRRDACRQCPSRTRRWGSDWCGPPFEDRTDAEQTPTCGCLLAGKLVVASETCPQNRW